MRNRRRDTDKLIGVKILIVEDEGVVALDLETLLSEHGGITVGPAASISKALELIDEEDPDLAVLDLNLRGESALPVASALFERDVPFGIVSGYGRLLSGHPDLKGVPLLEKPIDHAKFLQLHGGARQIAGHSGSSRRTAAERRGPWLRCLAS